MAVERLASAAWQSTSWRKPISAGSVDNNIWSARLRPRPLDQQPVLQQQFRDQLVMPDANAHARKARRPPIGRAFPPPDRAPGPLGETKRQLFSRDQMGLVAPPRIVQRLPRRFGPAPDGHFKVF